LTAASRPQRHPWGCRRRRHESIAHFLSYRCDGDAGIDAGKRHDVDRNNPQDRVARRGLGERGAARGHAYDTECAIRGRLAGGTIAGIFRELGQRVGQFSDGRHESSALVRRGGNERTREHESAAAEQIEVASVLILAYHRGHPRLPDQRVAGDPAAHTAQAAQLDQA
jgi:hypothetical protein